VAPVGKNKKAELDFICNKAAVRGKYNLSSERLYFLSFALKINPSSSSSSSSSSSYVVSFKPLPYSPIVNRIFASSTLFLLEGRV
jgi:hypothetical protein